MYTILFQLLFFYIYIKETPRLNQLSKHVCDISRKLEIRESEFLAISKARIWLLISVLVVG